jgi:hypothetical protein
MSFFTINFSRIKVYFHESTAFEDYLYALEHKNPGQNFRFYYS